MGKYKNIYVLSPYGVVTGGVELAHQLVDNLRKKGENAFIVYDMCGEIIEKDVIPAYSKYDIATSSVIEDESCNMLVLPEIYGDWTFRYKKIIYGFWWMSVDNRYNCAHVFDRMKFCFDKSMRMFVRLMLGYVKRRLLGQKGSFQNKDKDLRGMGERIVHFYQSYYAQNWIYGKGFTTVLPLTDYINDDLCTSGATAKEDIILYNPSKGFEFTQKIMRALPGYKFVALKGFNREQLNEIFDRAKLYIDFGHFPGKDRLPREAAVHNCCVITGRAGAAFFYEDLPISMRYKFDIKEKNVGRIAERVKEVLANYDSCVGDFDELRSAIAREKSAFDAQVDVAFGLR